MPLASNAPFDPTTSPCTCEGWSDQNGKPHEMCVCAKGAGGAERVLRFVMHVDGRLSSAQREWCLTEIDSVEGHRRADHEHDTDGELAHATIDAWTDYCRDKGLM